jgi:kumamolisin
MASLGHTKSLAAMLLAGTALAVVGGGAAAAAEAGLAPLPAQAIGNNVNGAPAGGPTIIVPPSDKSVAGVAHTNVKLLALPDGAAVPPAPGLVPPPSQNLVETPASVACAYRMAPGFTGGCSPTAVTITASGGSKAIAVVTAFHNPNALNDLNVYSSYFNLPQLNGDTFSYVYAGASGCNNAAVPLSGVGTGWDLEAAMAVEAAHALAPGAKIWLVEAQSATINDLMAAVDTATACLQQRNSGGQVVIPWSLPEFSTEALFDSSFKDKATVTYVSAAGDVPGVSYPAASPYVVGVGGTTFSRNQSNGNFKSEAVWNDAFYGAGTGGGPSAYESLPSFQNFAPLNQLAGSKRATPDLAALADPVNGFWVYNTTYQNGWAPVGGTGLAASLMAGYFNWRGFFWGSSTNALNNIYALAQSGVIVGYTTNVNSGLCGPGGALGGLGQGYNPQWIEAKYSGLTWDWCTGWGSPKGPY